MEAIGCCEFAALELLQNKSTMILSGRTCVDFMKSPPPPPPPQLHIFAHSAIGLEVELS